MAVRVGSGSSWHYIGGADDELVPMMEQGGNEQLDKLVTLLAG